MAGSLNKIMQNLESSGNKSDQKTLEPIRGAGKYVIGTQVKHKIFGFRGVIFDVDPIFSNSEEWYQSIPKDFRPKKEQPFYHLLAETPEKSPYVAYVSEQNLILDDENLNTWIYGTEEEVKRLIRPNSNIKLDYYQL